MIEALLVVLTNAVDGRDDDFNDWYTHIHTRDALRFRGSIAQQRFRFAADQVQEYPQGFVAKYLALYEVYDAALFTQEHIDNAQTKRMVIENSIDISRLDDFHYYPLQYRDRAPRSFGKGSVVMEQIDVPQEQRRAFEDWYNDSYMPQRMKTDGVISGAFLAYDPHGQMVNFGPDHSHVAIYRLADDSARSAWRNNTLLAECPHSNRKKLAVTCWDIFTQRVTEDEVLNTSATALAAEEKARARIERQGTLMLDRGDLKES